MKIIIIGLPYFVKKLALQLNKVDKGNHYIGLDTNGKNADKIKFLYHILTTRLLISIGGSFEKGNAFKVAGFFKKKILLEWVGSDVLEAQKSYESGKIDHKFISRSYHYCVSTWLQDELAKMNLKAKLIKQHVFIENFKPPVPFPGQFSILTYIGADRPEFYGINRIKYLAEKFRNVPIKVVGLAESNTNLPANVELLGWVKNFEEIIDENIVFFRVTDHDGMPLSVLEALARGRHVIYSNPVPETITVNNQNELVDSVSKLFEKFKLGKLEINHAGIDFVKESYNKQTVISAILNSIQEVLND